MRKLFLSIIFSIIGSSFLNAQEVEIKDDQVLLDGVAILKYEKINVSQHSFYSLDTDEEILLFKWHDNETNQYTQDDYIILNFLTLKTKVETTNVELIISGLGMNSKKNMQKLVKWLLKEKVIDNKGTLNSAKVEIFYEKYNEDITERTSR
ncbi:MAG TPA: hypothetical protein VK164_03950 [Flavobacterium sp.]|uniref:hypothetical protein n=1 Tax=Flavobacterium sp. TaxID=239 RepID=UPI002B4B4E6D|nr:hypothetical protein [Flavobacterium sp.]HLO73067.1 hypothetical protein [Flavobacterium sp.]